MHLVPPAFVAIVALALASPAAPQETPADGSSPLAAPARQGEDPGPAAVQASAVALSGAPSPAPAPGVPGASVLAPQATPGIVPGSLLPHFGILFATGIPSGVGVSAVFRPARALRVTAGPAWNYAAWGIQGGVTLAPWSWGITPTLGVEVGRFFDADLSRFVRNANGIPDGAKPLMQRVGYGYAAAMVGFEFGSQSGLAFFLRGGLAYFSLEARGSGTTTTSGGTAGANDALVTLTDPRVRATLPSLQLGMQYFF